MPLARGLNSQKSLFHIQKQDVCSNKISNLWMCTTMAQARDKIYRIFKSFGKQTFYIYIIVDTGTIVPKIIWLMG